MILEKTCCKAGNMYEIVFISLHFILSALSYVNFYILFTFYGISMEVYINNYFDLSYNYSNHVW